MPLNAHSSLIFPNMVMWHIKLKGLMSRTDASTISTIGLNWRPWGGVKRSNFNYKVDLKDFLPNFECVLINKRCKTHRMEFSFCRLGHAPGVGLGGAGAKNFNVGICDGTPSTAHSRLKYYFHTCFMRNLKIRASL